MNFVKHENTWSWGNSTIIITEDACGTVTVQFDRNFPDEAFITSLSVYKEKRNQGYGTMLIKEAEKYAMEHGIFKTALRSDKNSWTVEWYKRLGYELERIQFSDEDFGSTYPVLSKKLK